jgi:hypothetical protein
MRGIGSHSYHAATLCFALLKRRCMHVYDACLFSRAENLIKQNNAKRETKNIKEKTMRCILTAFFSPETEQAATVQFAN